MIRNTIKILAALLLSMAVACTDTQGIDVLETAQPPDTIHTVRPARLIVPESYDHTVAYPLVFAFHGYTSNADDLVGSLDLDALADDLGFIVVAPNGTIDPEGSPFWNIELDCCDFLEQGVDDIGYVQELLSEVTGVVSVDAQHISVLGSSNGAFFSYQLACKLPEVFNLIISIAGAVPVDPQSCESPAPVSVIQVHGKSDSIVSYDNDVGTKDRDKDDVFALETTGALNTAARMRAINGCDETVSSVEKRDYVDGVEGQETVIQRWNTCDADHSVELWTFNETDHVVPLVTNDAFRLAIGNRIAER